MELLKFSTCFKTFKTSGLTSTPSTTTGLLSCERSAVCRTARSSVVFIFSPLNCLALQPSTSALIANLLRRPKVLSFILFFEKSNKKSSNAR